MADDGHAIVVAQMHRVTIAAIRDIVSSNSSSLKTPNNVFTDVGRCGTVGQGQVHQCKMENAKCKI